MLTYTLLTHCPLTCCRHLWGWHLVLEEHLEEEEMHLGPSGVRVRVRVGVGVGGRARLRERLGTVELAHEDEEATRGDGKKATRGGALLVGAVLLGLWLAVMVIDLGLGHTRELELPGARLSQLRRLPTEAALACGRKRRVDRWGRLWRGRCGDGEGGGYQRAHVLLCGRPRAFGRRPLRPGLRLPLDLLPVVVEGALLDAAGALPRVGARVKSPPLATGCLAPCAQPWSTRAERMRSRSRGQPKPRENCKSRKLSLCRFLRQMAVRQKSRLTESKKAGADPYAL